MADSGDMLLHCLDICSNSQEMNPIDPVTGAHWSLPSPRYPSRNWKCLSEERSLGAPITEPWLGHCKQI